MSLFLWDHNTDYTYWFSEESSSGKFKISLFSCFTNLSEKGCNDKIFY